MRHADGIGVTFLVNRNFNGFLAVHTDDGFTFAVSCPDIGDVAQVHRTDFTRRNDQVAEFLHRPELIDGAHQVTLGAFLEPARRYVHVFGREPRAEIIQRQIQLGHLALIDFDLDFVFQPTADLDCRHALDRFQSSPDFLVGIAAQCFKR